MRTGTQKYDVSLAKEFQEHLKKSTANMVSLIKENKKGSWKENGQTDSIIFRILMMFNTNMLKCIVTQINSHNYHFMVHIPNLMAQGG